MPDLDIRGEMEAAAAALEAEGQSFDGDGQDASPASEDPKPEGDQQPKGDDAAPATEGTPAADDPKPAAQPEDELPIGGSIPVPRVRKILENARTKAKAEVEAQLQAIAWAKDVKREDVDEALALAKFADENPAELTRVIIGRMRQNPQTREAIDAVLSSFGMAQPAQPAQPKPEETDPAPKPNVLLEDGRLVYDAEQMQKLLEWKERQIEGKVSAKLRPFEERTAQEEQLRRVEAVSRQKLAEVVKWPGMDNPENRKAVAETMMNKRVTVDDAYRMVVLPKLTDTKAIEDRVRKQVLEELKLKGRASTKNPGTPAPDPSTMKGKSIREILEATAAQMGMED